MGKPAPTFWWDFAQPGEGPIIVQSDYEGGQRLAEFHFQDSHGVKGSAEAAIMLAQRLCDDYAAGRKTPVWNSVSLRALIVVGTYMMQRAEFLCDIKCNKAWGITERPTVQFNPDEEPDDFAWYADDELGEAPQHLNTREGGHAKPTSIYFGRIPVFNKWCARQCERQCGPVPDCTAAKARDFSKRVYNMPSRHTD